MGAGASGDGPEGAFETMGSVAQRGAQAALVLAPWAGLGLVHVLTGRSLGAGVQPAYLPLLLLIGVAGWSVLRARDTERPLLLTCALAWTLATTTWLWTRDVVGLAGDVPWTKGLKQFVLLTFFASAAAAFAWCATRVELRRLERAASVGLAIAGVVALVQAVTFHLSVPGGAGLERLVSSNPSIASGSGELYLGDRFVGIPRVRGPFPEPLHFGSYLLAAVPVTFAGAWAARGAGRAWRVGVGLLGLLCLLMTFSRGAWFGAVAVGFVLAVGMGRGVLPRPSRRLVVGTVAGALVLATIGWPVLTGQAVWELPGLLVQRVQQSFAGHDMSNLTRFWSWRVAWDLFADHPVGGVGFGGFGFWYFERAGAIGSGAHFGWPVVNNLPLQLLAETGAAVFLLWAACLVPALRPLWQRRAGAAAFLLAACVVGTVVHLLTFSQWDLPHLWILFGLAAGMGRRIPQVV